MTPLRQGLCFSVRTVSRSNRMLFYAILKVLLVEILLICIQCTSVHQYHSVWDYSSPNSCPRQRTETVNLLRSQLKQEKTHFHFFQSSFRLENLLSYQECNIQHFGISRENKLWIWAVNSVLAPEWRIHICKAFFQEIPCFSLP